MDLNHLSPKSINYLVLLKIHLLSWSLQIGFRFGSFECGSWLKLIWLFIHIKYYQELQLDLNRATFFFWITAWVCKAWNSDIEDFGERDEKKQLLSFCLGFLNMGLTGKSLPNYSSSIHEISLFNMLGVNFKVEQILALRLLKFKHLILEYFKITDSLSVPSKVHAWIIWWFSNMCGIINVLNLLRICV